MSTLFYGTPEYEAYQATQAPHRAAAEARRVASNAERAERDARRAKIRAELDRIKAEIDKWSAEHEPHYQTMEAARIEAAKKNKAFTRALNSYNSGKISESALLRSALASQATAEIYNALLPAYNARIEHNDRLWKERQDAFDLLYSITPNP